MWRINAHAALTTLGTLISSQPRLDDDVGVAKRHCTKANRMSHRRAVLPVSAIGIDESRFFSLRSNDRHLKKESSVVHIYLPGFDDAPTTLL